MKIEKISFRKFLKVVFGTLGIISLLGLLFLIGGFIKMCFFNGFSFESNIYNLKSGIEYYFDEKTKNLTDCEDLTQDDVTILNEKLEVYGYSGDKNYWCDLGKIRINNEVDTIYNEYVNKDFKIPKEIYKLQNLYLLHITSLNTADVLDFKNISNLTNLVDLSINVNTGSLEIPEEIYNIKTLKYLGISGEGFTGSIFSNIGNLEKLKTLRIVDTNVGGELPDELFNLIDFREIFLSRNKFIGEVSDILDKLKNIKKFNIYKNKFIGEFPGKISDLKSFYE